MNPLPGHPNSTRIRRGALALLAWLAATSGTGAPTSIVVTLDDNYPPYVFRDAEGTLKGILPDQWSLWEKKTGAKVDLRAMDWVEAQRFMREGHADVIDTIFLTEERAKIYDFTPPYAQIEVPVFAHETLGGIADISSLKGFTVGVKAGDAVVEFLATNGIDSLKEYPSYEAIVLAAKNQEIKIFSVDKPAAVYFMYKHGIADQFNESMVLYTGEFHRAVGKNRRDLLGLVQNGFGRISKREYRAIERKWLGTPFLLKETLRQWGLWLLAIFAAILVLVTANVFLTRRIHAKTSELRKALDDLRRSQTHLQRILAVAPVGIGLVVERRFVEVNDAFCKLSGYSAAELIGQSTRPMYASDEEFERVGQTLYAQIARAGIGTMEVAGRRKDGVEGHWWLNGSCIDPARPAEGIIFTVMDITERKKSEDELRASHTYFSTVFNAVNDALIIHDAQTGRLLDVNQRACEMSGYSRDDFLRLGIEPMCAGMPPYALKDIEKWNRKALTDGPQNVEFMTRHRDGHLFWVEASIRRVQIDSNDRLLVAIRDITERKAAEEKRLNVERRLQEAQKLESLAMLAGGVAHDFNNLLTAILGNIDLALLDIPHVSPARDSLLTAMTATHRAAGLAQQMLAYSGKGRFAVESVDVPSVIRETAQILRVSISKNADLRIHFPGDLPLIEADPSQFRQVVMNLVLNASEAMDNKPGTIDISAGVVEGASLPPARLWPREKLSPGRYLYVEVADSGAGIPPDIIEKIFDPFFSTKFTGRGLGLAAVLGILRSHNGAIQVDSQLGTGTHFRAYFPIQSESPVPAPAAPPPAAAPPDEGLILLVDDEPSLRETVSKLLARMGFQVLCAADGEQAVQLFRLQAARISGVILDLTMPKLDGVQTLSALRNIRSDVPVLVSSGYSRAEINQRFAGLPINGFIPKPYTLEGLRQALEQALSP